MPVLLSSLGCNIVIFYGSEHLDHYSPYSVWPAARQAARSTAQGEILVHPMGADIPRAFGWQNPSQAGSAPCTVEEFERRVRMALRDAVSGQGGDGLEWDQGILVGLSNLNDSMIPSFPTPLSCFVFFWWAQACVCLCCMGVLIALRLCSWRYFCAFENLPSLWLGMWFFLADNKNVIWQENI